MCARPAEEGPAALRFYRYQREVQPLRVLEDEEKIRLKRRLEEAVENPPVRNETFLSRLFEAAGQKETEAKLTRTSLMGFPLGLHKIAADELAEVDRELRTRAQRDPEIEGFFKSLRMIGGYAWRNIAGTSSRRVTGEKSTTGAFFKIKLFPAAIFKNTYVITTYKMPPMKKVIFENASLEKYSSL